MEKLKQRREALVTLDRLREEYDRSAALSIAAAAFSKRAAGHAAALAHAAVKDPRYAAAAAAAAAAAHAAATAAAATEAISGAAWSAAADAADAAWEVCHDPRH